MHRCPHRHHLDPQYLDYAGKSGHQLACFYAGLYVARSFARSFITFINTFIICLFISLNLLTLR